MLKDREHVSALLKRGQWFDGLPEKLQELILDSAVDRSYAKRETIVREGEIGRGLCAVLEGRVNTVARGGAEREMLIHVAEPGYWFGIFDILLDGAPRPDTAYADTNARILLLSTASFKDIVETEPRYYPYFAKLLIERYVIVFGSSSTLTGCRPRNGCIRGLRLWLPFVARTRPAQGRFG
jgi:CRP-like cAMP-binding protein